MNKEASVDAAINRCLSEGFLVDFLKDKKEVSKMILGNNITMEEYGQVQRENGRLEGLEEGRAAGREEGREEGGITTLILDNLEEGFPKEKILAKLMKRFNLSEEDAARFYDKVAKTL